MARKVFLIVGVLAAVVVAVVIFFAVNGIGSSSSSSNSDGKKSDNSTLPAGAIIPGAAISDESLLGNSKTGSAADAGPKEPTSDPTKLPVAMTMLAIGDWGATTGKPADPGSCCNQYRKEANDSLETKIDFYAQINVAEILAQSAGELKPKPERIIGHGDNIYWNGVGPGDVAYRMDTTFESVYKQPALQGITWLNVVGNHDIGGSEFICGEKDYNFVECPDQATLLKYLNLKFQLQSDYKSPNDDRWKMPAHYFKESVVKNGVSVDIFNVDTNFADSHGARQVCCQCYGYVKAKKLGVAETKALGKTCETVDMGHPLCAGGNAAMYTACFKQIEEWWTDSMTKVQKDLAASTATWKIINSHYSPHFHMSEDKMKQWYSITKKYGVQLWLNGHTHSFDHDLAAWGTHFIENGGGGGIQSESAGMPPQVAHGEYQ